jgi:hypothetical protein
MWLRAHRNFHPIRDIIFNLQNICPLLLYFPKFEVAPIRRLGTRGTLSRRYLTQSR